MKANKVERRRPRSIIAIAAIIFLAAVTVGVTAAYSKLRDLWIAQCVVTDVTAQATCTDGTMVKGGTVLDKFGIRNGANLALIDFDAKRREILDQIPNIRSISVVRRMPNRVEITVEERHPVVRMGIHGCATVTGRVADTEGVVFSCRRGTSMLPTIRESKTAITQVGRRLTGRNLAALRLVETASDAEFASLGMLDLDVTKQDYILATLGNYSQAKIAWEGMDNPTESNRPNLVTRLQQLYRAVKNPDNVGSDAKTWNATIPNRIFADTTEPIS